MDCLAPGYTRRQEVEQDKSIWDHTAIQITGIGLRARRLFAMELQNILHPVKLSFSCLNHLPRLGSNKLFNILSIFITTPTSLHCIQSI